MLEFLALVSCVGFLAISKHQQIRLILAHYARSFRKVTARQYVHPYRQDPESERDLARQRADIAEAEIERLQRQLYVARAQRDLFRSHLMSRGFRARAEIGGAFALGVLVSLSSLTVAPQIAQDLQRAHACSTRLSPEVNAYTRSCRADTMLLTYRVPMCRSLRCSRGTESSVFASHDFSWLYEPQVRVVPTTTLVRESRRPCRNFGAWHMRQFAITPGRSYELPEPSFMDELCAFN